MKKDISKDIEKYNIELQGDLWIGYRICVNCKKTIQYKSNKRYYLIRNLKNNDGKNCNACNQKGENNGFFGKNHTKKTKNKQSKNRIGKACGKDNAMSNPKHRKRVSEALKNKYESGELDYLKEIQRKTAIKNQANGKLKTAPISKAEVEIKKELEDSGFVVESQYNIGSLKYDLFVKEKQLLIEYNGDYWHCNPKKYNETYFHQKKKMTAKEIWKRDKEKQNLAISSGFKIITIWEMDYNENKNREIRKIYEK